MSSASPYQPGREIARGGMGAIMEVRDERFGRVVAMKVMPRAYASDTERQRFLLEAQVLGWLAHPNIVPVHDLGTDVWGRPFYTMKLVQGVTLHDILARLREGDSETVAKYPLNQLLTIFQKVCDAVAFAHSRGVLHRDLKPQNIMVGEFGEVLVMDWGLAKILPGSSALQPPPAAEPGGWIPAGGEELERKLFLEPAAGKPAIPNVAPPVTPPPDEGISDKTPTSPSASQLTLEGSVLGTPQFMSPEQAHGELAKLDARSDVYALGAILYSILTLRPPVDGQDMRQLIARARNPNIVAPITVAENERRALASAGHEPTLQSSCAVVLRHCPDGLVPVALSAVAMKALRRERAERYQSVVELVRDIEAYQHGFATSAENADALTLARLFIRRHRVLTAAGTLVLLVILIALPLVIAAQRKASRNAVLAGESEQKAHRNAATAHANELKAEANAKQAQAAESRAEQEAEAARRALAEAKIALAETHLRDSDVASARRVLGQVPEELRDSNWTYLLARTDTSLATLRSFQTEQIVRVAANPAKPGAFAMLGADNYLSMVDARTGRRDGAVRLGDPITSGHYVLSVSPDGGEMALANETSDQIAFYRPGSGKPVRTWRTQRPLAADFSPTERVVLVVPLPNRPGSEELWLHDADTGAVKWKFNTSNVWNHAAFLPNGKSIIVAYGTDRACLVDTATGRRLRDLPSTVAPVYHVTASPDGAMYAVGDSLGVVRVFSLVDSNLMLAFRAAEGWVHQIFFTPESRRIVTIGANPVSRANEVRVWSVASGYAIQTLLGGEAQPFRGALHPRSGELVVAGPVAKSWALEWRQPGWLFPGDAEDSRAGFPGEEDHFFLGERGQAAFVRLGENGATTSLWRAPAGRNLADLSGDGHLALVRALDGERDFGLLQRETETPAETATWNPAFAVNAPTRLSPSGDRVWIGRAIVNARTGAELHRFPDSFPVAPWAGEWLDANRLLVAYTDTGREMLGVADAGTGQFVCRAPVGERRFLFCASPDGRLVAETSRGKIVRLRDTTKLAVQREFRAHDGSITALRFHPVEPLLATGSEDYTIRFWQTDSGAMARELRGALVSPRHLAFSPSGQRLAGIGTDYQVRIWDLLETSRPAPPPGRLLLPDWQDLLAQLKPDAVAASGQGWRFKDGQLHSPARKYATVPLAGGFTQTDYHLQVRFRRREPQDSFTVFLPVGGRQTGFVIDGYPRAGGISGLHYLDGDGGLKQPGAVRGLQVKDTAPHQLDLLVRTGPRVSSIEVKLDDRPFYRWSGLTTALSMNGNFTGLASDQIGLGAHADEWTVESVRVKSLEPKP
jgi:eukaryotic-like serine/threonine-protein kinase